MKIAILTQAYPFYPGEQFIEDEILYWNESLFSEVFLVPKAAQKVSRPIPENINLDLTLSKSGILENIWFSMVAIFSPIFFKELNYLFHSKKFNICTLGMAYISVSKTLKSAKKIRYFAKTNNGLDLVYCYWNEFSSYGAILVKKDGLVSKVITRFHNNDLYEYRKTNNYMPLKRQFLKSFDVLYTISEEGASYLVKTYNVQRNVIKISPLGVPIPHSISRVSSNGHFHIISVSFCVPHKRIDKIIDSIELVSSKKIDTFMRWTHIGDGPLFEELKKHANTKLAGKKTFYLNSKGIYPIYR